MMWRFFLSQHYVGMLEGCAQACPNGAKTQLLMHTNTNYLLDLCILLGLFDRGYQLITQKVCILLIKYWSPLREQGSFQGCCRSQG
jgi:hypothetical protein